MLGSPRIHRRARSDSQARAPRGVRGIQIGPRIRVGGTIGAIGQNVKNAVTKGASDVGHAVGNVATNPWVDGGLAAFLAATGVGAPAAAAIMAATKGGGELIKPGGNLGNAAAGAAKGAVLGAGAAKAGDLLYGGLGSIGSSAGASGAGGGLINAASGAIKGVLGGGGAPGAGGAGGGGGPDLSSLLKILGLGGAAVAGVQGYKDAKQAGASQDAALNANTAIAGQLHQQGTDLLAGAAPIRNAAQTAMTQRLAAGPRVSPQIPAFRSPFAYTPAVPAPPARV